MAEKHTPAMWESCDRGDYSDDGVVILGDDLRIAVVNREEDAAFIVRAVNSHDKLVEALEKLLHAVCGETGFAACVRADSGRAYPWPAIDEAEALSRSALASLQPREEGR